MVFNIFKRNKKKDRELAEKKGQEQKHKTKKTISVSSPNGGDKKVEKEGKETQPEGKGAAKKSAKKVSEIAYRVLIKPHITEKASILAQDNRYLFEVFQSATKGQVVQAVKAVYDVEVKSVRMVRIPSKKVRLGKRREGVKKGYKKAIVQLEQGQKIEIMPR